MTQLNLKDPRLPARPFILICNVIYKFPLTKLYTQLTDRFDRAYMFTVFRGHKIVYYPDQKVGILCLYCYDQIQRTHWIVERRLSAYVNYDFIMSVPRFPRGKRLPEAGGQADLLFDLLSPIHNMSLASLLRSHSRMDHASLSIFVSFPLIFVFMCGWMDGCISNQQE